MHHFVSHIVVAFTWSFAFVLPHPNAWIIVIYCGVIFFPLFSFSVGSLSLLHCILFDFGTFLFHSTAQVKWSKPKNMTGTRYGTGQIDKVNKKKTDWTLLPHSDVEQERRKTFSCVALEKRLFHFCGAASRQIILITSFFCFSFFFSRFFSENAIICDDKLHMCVVSKCRG